jgi:hypothetical protein
MRIRTMLDAYSKQLGERKAQEAAADSGEGAVLAIDAASAATPAPALDTPTPVPAPNGVVPETPRRLPRRPPCRPPPMPPVTAFSAKLVYKGGSSPSVRGRLYPPGRCYGTRKFRRIPGSPWPRRARLHLLPMRPQPARPSCESSPRRRTSWFQHQEGRSSRCTISCRRWVPPQSPSTRHGRRAVCRRPLSSPDLPLGLRPGGYTCRTLRATVLPEASALGDRPGGLARNGHGTSPGGAHGPPAIACAPLLGRLPSVGSQ